MRWKIFGKKRKKKMFQNNLKTKLFLKLYFIFGSILIILFFVIYSNSLILKVRTELEVLPQIYAELLEGTTKDNFETYLMNYFLKEFPQKINYPIIVTTEEDEPKYWKNIEVVQKPFQQLTENEKKKLNTIFQKMINSKNPIFLSNPQTDELICKIYFSESSTMKKLRFVPYFEFFILFLFITFGTFGFILLKNSEKKSLWVALAKETAHQFGTPVSSLLGWIEILQSKKFSEMNAKKQAEILNQIKFDIKHLENIASKFGKVGSSIELKKSDLDKTIQSIIDYFATRMPKEKYKININYTNKTQNCYFHFDSDLLKWALENLIKNSIDAMKNRSGNISLITYENRKNIYIQIKDEGIGIPSKMQKVIFNTGVTTKNRGWGLGLSLAKRIVENFHKGKIYLLKSEKYVETIFEISLPKNMKKR